jgi:hypothetical protein
MIVEVNPTAVKQPPRPPLYWHNNNNNKTAVHCHRVQVSKNKPNFLSLELILIGKIKRILDVQEKIDMCI